MRRIFYTLTLIFISVSLRAQQMPSDSAVKAADNFLLKFARDLADGEAFSDGLDARRSANVPDIGFIVNKELLNVFKRFTEQTGIGIGLKGSVLTDNMIWKCFNVTNYKGTYKEGSGLLFDLKFIPNFEKGSENDRPYFIKIELDMGKVPPIASKDNGISSGKWGEFWKYLKDVNDTPPLYRRNDFKDSVNKIISEGLSILSGIRFEDIKNRGDFITVDGKEAFNLDIQAELDRIKGLDESEPKLIEVFTLRIPEKNDYKISSSNKDILFGSDNKTDIDILFSENSDRTEAPHIDVYYRTENRTIRLFRIQLIRVIPSIAFEQKGNIDYIRKETSYTSSSDISSYDNTMSLRPVFLTNEYLDEVKDFRPLFERNKHCAYLVESIKFDGKQYDVDELDWREFSLGSTNLTYEIKMKNNDIVVQGIINPVEDFPFITVIRDRFDRETGYYIEDYYLTALDQPPHRSLRNLNNSMNEVSIDGLTQKYRIPIVHYKEGQSSVKLLLADIDNMQNPYVPSQHKYTIGNETYDLGKQSTLQIPKKETTLDIKDMKGNIRGKIEFRPAPRTTISPTINIVTINTDAAGVSLTTVCNDLNKIYNTMNVNWLQGKQIRLNITGINEDDFNNIKTNARLRSKILSALENNDDYKSDQYYMIIVPASDDFGGFTTSLNSNHFFTQQRYSIRIPAHELGHCSGLNEFVINIGELSTSATQQEIENNNFQRKSTNVMGYQPSNSLTPLIDFYSWQVQKLRERIQERLNTK
jgi:hypothetical protein